MESNSLRLSLSLIPTGLWVFCNLDLWQSQHCSHKGEASEMAPATPLSDPAKGLLDYHRAVPDNDPRFASCLIEKSCIKSLAELDAAYDELEGAGYVEPVGLGWAIDQNTREKLTRPSFQCRPPVR
jgi:hypothetical protein